MNFPLTRHRISTGAFTLVEMMVAASVFTVVGVAVLGVLISTSQLSSENVAANMSNFRARQTLDRVGTAVRYGQNTPVLISQSIPTLIDPAGPSSATAGDGVLVNSALDGSYVFWNSDGSSADIPAGATKFAVDYVTATGAAPVKGDWFHINLSTQPELEVKSVDAPSVVGTLTRVVVTTQAGLPESATPSTYFVTATRFRKEAYVFAPRGTQWDLRRYPRVVAATLYTDATSYVTMGVGFQRLTANQAWFTTETSAGTRNVWLRALARSSDHDEYNEFFTRRDSLTVMPVQSKLWNYNPPPP